MIDFISKKVLKWLISTEAVKREESDIYLFGIHYGILSIINMLTTFLIGAALGCLKESIVFVAVFLPLRSYAGGYHARTEGRCYIASAILSCGLLLLSKVYPCNRATFLVLVLSVLMIWFASPVADENKPSDEMEDRIYLGKKRKILIVELMSLALCYLFRLYWAVRMISVSFLALCVILMLGELRNKLVRCHFEGSKSD